MNKYNLSAYISTSIYIILTISILSNVTNTLGSIIGNIIYLIALLLIGIVGFFAFLKNHNYPRYLLPLLLYLFIIIIGLLWTVNTERTVIHIIQISAILLLFLIIHNDNHNKLYAIYACSMIYLSIVAMVWIWSGFEYDHSGIFNSRNANGAYLYYISYFVLFYILIKDNNYRYNKLLIAVIIILLIFIRSRSIWLAMIAALLTYYIWPFICKNKFRYNAYILSVFSLIFCLISIYLYLATYPEGRVLNQFILEYTGGQLFSGRDELWPILIQRINENIFFGYGPGVLISDFVDIEWAGSAHNLYIQTLFQTGVIGVVILISLLYSIWVKITQLKNRKIGRLIAAFFISMLIHQMFEVSLTQNRFVLGLIQWFIIFFTLNYFKNESFIYSKQVIKSCN